MLKFIIFFSVLINVCQAQAENKELSYMETQSYSSKFKGISWITEWPGRQNRKCNPEDLKNKYEKCLLEVALAHYKSQINKIKQEAKEICNLKYKKLGCHFVKIEDNCQIMMGTNLFAVCAPIVSITYKFVVGEIDPKNDSSYRAGKETISTEAEAKIFSRSGSKVNEK